MIACAASWVLVCALQSQGPEHGPSQSSSVSLVNTSLPFVTTSSTLRRAGDDQEEDFLDDAIMRAARTRAPGAKTVRKKKVGRRLIALIQALPSVQWVAQHPANVSALPFDGIVMLSDPPRNSDSDFSFMTQRNVSLNAAALKLQLDQLRGLELGSATDNFVLVHATPAGSFASYVEPGKVATNFGLLAAAASAAGLTGIFFDVECYLVRTRHLCQCGRRPDTRVACSICGQSSVPGSCSHHSAFHLV